MKKMNYLLDQNLLDQMNSSDQNLSSYVNCVVNCVRSVSFTPDMNLVGIRVCPFFNI